MKTYQFSREKLEQLMLVCCKIIYSKNGWDEPTVLLLDSFNDCKIVYSKLSYPKMMVDKSLINDNLNKIVVNFWAQNGQKYGWDFVANRENYSKDILVKHLSNDFQQRYLEMGFFRTENISDLCDIVMDGLIFNNDFYKEILSILSLPNEFQPNYLKPILRAVIEDELLDYCFFNHLSIFCRTPIFYYNTERQLHNPFGPAIEFPNGESYYYWKGREVAKKWIEQPAQISRKDLIAEHNLEDRRVLQEILGDEGFAKLLDLQVTEIDNYNGQAVYLLRTSSPDRTIQHYLYFIKVICNSTSRQYHICIPEDAYNLGAIGALSWTFGMEANEYQLLVET